jgi:predicted nucleic acid-binding protein
VKVIVDTSVWSLFLRRTAPRDSWQILALERRLRTGRVQLLGIIRQELLSGIREQSQFERLQDALAGLPDLLATTQDHVLAAQCYNLCRGRGVQGSAVDFLICAQAINHGLPILTSDKDFEAYAEILPLKLIEESV